MSFCWMMVFDPSPSRTMSQSSQKHKDEGGFLFPHFSNASAFIAHKTQRSVLLCVLCVYKPAVCFSQYVGTKRKPEVITCIAFSGAGRCCVHHCHKKMLYHTYTHSRHRVVSDLPVFKYITHREALGDVQQ